MCVFLQKSKIIEKRNYYLMLNYNNIKKYISAARLQRYEAICGNDPKKSLKLYQTNLRLSQAFYPILSLFEIILRNAINDEMIRYYNDAEWLKNRMNSLVYRGVDPNTGKPIVNEYLKKKIANVIRNNRNASNGKIVSELSFGFWTDLFEPKYFPLVNGRPMYIFYTFPSGTNRSIISGRLKTIRDFRNRVYHNEPIIFGVDQNGNTIFYTQDCVDIYNELKAFFGYFNLDFKAWTQRIDNVLFEIQRAEFVHKEYPKTTYYSKRIALGIKHYRQKYI